MPITRRPVLSKGARNLFIGGAIGLFLAFSGVILLLLVAWAFQTRHMGADGDFWFSFNGRANTVPASEAKPSVAAPVPVAPQVVIKPTPAAMIVEPPPALEPVTQMVQAEEPQPEFEAQDHLEITLRPRQQTVSYREEPASVREIEEPYEPAPIVIVHRTYPQYYPNYQTWDDRRDCGRTTFSWRYRPRWFQRWENSQWHQRHSDRQDFRGWGNSRQSERTNRPSRNWQPAPEPRQEHARPRQR